jgi:Na+/H+ antiporter NhaD/arsenite permease-like protein
VSEAQAVASLIVEKVPYLAAISAGAVFMGANTYIGNAPNFMVKSIAEEAGVKMPSFFGYMFKYSIPVLVVLFIIITVIFF